MRRFFRCINTSANSIVGIEYFDLSETFESQKLRRHFRSDLMNTIVRANNIELDPRVRQDVATETRHEELHAALTLGIRKTKKSVRRSVKKSLKLSRRPLRDVPYALNPEA